jgi:hypothetical protein
MKVLGGGTPTTLETAALLFVFLATITHESAWWRNTNYN